MEGVDYGPALICYSRWLSNPPPQSSTNPKTILTPKPSCSICKLLLREYFQITRAEISPKVYQSKRESTKPNMQITSRGSGPDIINEWSGTIYETLIIYCYAWKTAFGICSRSPSSLYLMSILSIKHAVEEWTALKQGCHKEQQNHCCRARVLNYILLLRDAPARFECLTRLGLRPRSRGTCSLDDSQIDLYLIFISFVIKRHNWQSKSQTGKNTKKKKK